MTGWRTRLRSIALVAALLLVGSCDSATDRTGETPLAPSFSNGNNGNHGNGNNGNRGNDDDRDRDRDRDRDQDDITLITERLPFPLPDLDVSRVIGPNGGTLTVLGHTLEVPRGAVNIPTLFTMTVLLTPVIDVDLSATITTVTGRVIDVGRLGFRKPVTLSLTYRRATNVDDPKDLFLVHINGRRLEELRSTVDRQNKLVSSKLDHFSKYAIGTD